ncbi:MAG: hypothetical protein EOO88_42785 [Pedobacter sp.]|nr:MAG: hypothetical protein EOO88_42785 [Pedobacter sp.]
MQNDRLLPAPGSPMALPIQLDIVKHQDSKPTGHPNPGLVVPMYDVKEGRNMPPEESQYIHPHRYDCL